MTESQQQKQEAIELLRKRLAGKEERLRAVDDRLWYYFNGCANDVSATFGDEHDLHSMWELLCAAKFLRMFDTYDFNVKRVRYFIALREGTWRREGKQWKHVAGGLRLPATQGAKVYRWQPFQIFVLASVFGFHTWFDTGVDEDKKPELLATEEVRDGEVWDYRRMISEFIMYGPRKIDKTGLSAYIQVIFFLFMDFNSEIYSLAMAQYQSKILYDRTKFMLRQISNDGKGERIRMTEKSVTWEKKYQKETHNSKIVPLTAGGKAPDGTNTELLNWDELGSEPYTNGKSNMQAHINVCQSSMGQRRQPLTFGTTTAGTITSGPFIDKLAVIHKSLLMELDYDAGTATPTLTGDCSMWLLLEPDEYEKQAEDYILHSHALRRKINPMLGIVVQYDFYEREMEKARSEGGQKFAECVAKLFNVYTAGVITKWIKGDVIRKLQVPKRIDDCIYQDGWGVYVGMDFSHGDDLFAITYLAIDYHHNQKSDTMRGFAFADCEAWVLEETMKQSPNRELYEVWVQQGWLHVCPGKVFDSIYAINALAKHLFTTDDNGEPKMRLDIRGFGYDPAQSASPINNLKAWLQSIGVSADMIERMVVKVKQNQITFTPLIAHMEEMILAPEPWIEFSNSPLWPWQFDNVALEVNLKNDLRILIKGGPAASHKHDNISALADAVYLFDIAEGRVEVV